jgi:hypothetical protein
MQLATLSRQSRFQMQLATLSRPMLRLLMQPTAFFRQGRFSMQLMTLSAGVPTSDAAQDTFSNSTPVPDVARDTLPVWMLIPRSYSCPRRINITSSQRWIRGPNQGENQWVPAGFDAYTWLHLESAHFQISGNQIATIGVGGYGGLGDSESEEDTDWTLSDTPPNTPLPQPLDVKIPRTWRW